MTTYPEAARPLADVEPGAWDRFSPISGTRTDKWTCSILKRYCNLIETLSLFIQGILGLRLVIEVLVQHKLPERYNFKSGDIAGQSLLFAHQGSSDPGSWIQKPGCERGSGDPLGAKWDQSSIKAIALGDIVYGQNE